MPAARRAEASRPSSTEPNAMTNAQRQLLERILASKRFARSESLSRILLYLCENADAPAGELREYDIAVKALGRPPAFNPTIDPIIRVSIANIRARLRTYFESDGQNETLRLHIPKGQYRATFEAVEPAATATGNRSALRRFWAPYLEGTYDNAMVITELLFFRNDAGQFVRDIFINEVTGGLDQMRERVSGLDWDAFRPSFHFVSAGEMHAMLSLMRRLAGMDANIEVQNARFSSWGRLRDRNLILLGSSRTNSFLDSLQSGTNYVIDSDRIVNAAPQPGESPVYAGTRYMDGRLEKVREYAVVTRHPGLNPECAVTMIAANHGRAIEGAADFFTDEDRVRDLIHQMQLPADEPFPANFQVLLRIDMIDFDEEVTQVEYLTHRVLDPRIP
jgi:hypothetical protein